MSTVQPGARSSAPFLPASTNADYRGSILSPWFLALATLATLGPAIIHSFLPDGGAVLIAHLDLGDRGNLVLGLFRWEGATQLALGLAMAVVVVRYRSLTALFLALVAVERGLMSVQAWVFGPRGGHRPPEHYGSPVLALLALVFLALALKPRRG
jgi:hypothetical protein